jgi:hypothetical protein
MNNIELRLNIISSQSPRTKEKWFANPNPNERERERAIEEEDEEKFHTSFLNYHDSSTAIRGDHEQKKVH